MDNVLTMVGLALRAGRLAVGEEPVGTACRARDCRLLLLAADACGQHRPPGGALRQAGQCLTRLPPPAPGRSWGPRWAAGPAPWRR